MNNDDDLSDLPRPRWDDETGIYRDCSQCHGEGADGKGCENCLPQRDGDYERYCEANPPVVFHTGDPAEMAICTQILGGLGTRSADATSMLLKKFAEWREEYESDRVTIGGLTIKRLYETQGKDLRDYLAARAKTWHEAEQKRLADEREAERKAKSPQRVYRCGLCQKESRVAEPEPWERIPFPKCCGKVMKHVGTEGGAA